jgi:hypothetical protein
MGRACPYPSSWIPPTLREEGVRGKERRAQRGCVCEAGRGGQEQGEVAIWRSGRRGRTGWDSSMHGRLDALSAPDLQTLVSPLGYQEEPRCESGEAAWERGDSDE